ncbi:MAG: alpha/beta fold hydrolase [Rhodobacteraceae bacterium]|nr:alpha/beta fold hydrolase [Paracoccaceae bacterium]
MLAAAGCAPRGQLTVVDAAPVGATEVRLHTVTSRNLAEDGLPGAGRADRLSYHKVGILLPPERDVGELRWGGTGRIDPNRHITASRVQPLDGTAGFQRSLRDDLRRTGTREREVLVFVHGYNTNFAEATARFAQMMHDMRLPAVPVLFSWPSQARALGYVYDRDSVLISRDRLRQLLLEVRAAGADRILLAAHSMGAQLVMETLVQADLAQPGAAARLADSVVLISPDISVDVFLSQLSQISRIPQSLIVFTSAEDQALRLSTLVAGNSPRLGKPSTDPRLDDTGAIFLDVTAFNDRAHGDFGHLTVGTSPALIAMVPQLRDAARALGSGASSHPGPLAETLLTIRSAADTALTGAQ